MGSLLGHIVGRFGRFGKSVTRPLFDGYYFSGFFLGGREAAATLEKSTVSLCPPFGGGVCVFLGWFAALFVTDELGIKFLIPSKLSVV